MQTKPTPESVAAAAGYFILTSAWIHMMRQGDHGAMRLLEEFKKDLVHRSDEVSFTLARLAVSWKSLDLDEWRGELRDSFDYAVDVCLAGNPAINGVCGDPGCVCDEVN